MIIKLVVVAEKRLVGLEPRPLDSDQRLNQPESYSRHTAQDRVIAPAGPRTCGPLARRQMLYPQATGAHAVGPGGR